MRFESINSGRHGAMPFDVFESLVTKLATKTVSFHYEKEGAQRGLPSDVATVQFGDVAEGLWFNVRRGEIPEETQIELRQRPLSEWDKAVLSGAIVRKHGKMRMPNTTPIPVPKHLGWRVLLVMIGSRGLLRPSIELEQWLGQEMYNEIFTAVATTDAVKMYMTDDGFRVENKQDVSNG